MLNRYFCAPMPIAMTNDSRSLGHSSFPIPIWSIQWLTFKKIIENFQRFLAKKSVWAFPMYLEFSLCKWQICSVFSFNSSFNCLFARLASFNFAFNRWNSSTCFSKRSDCSWFNRFNSDAWFYKDLNLNKWMSCVTTLFLPVLFGLGCWPVWILSKVLILFDIIQFRLLNSYLVVSLAPLASPNEWFFASDYHAKHERDVD